VAKTLLSASQGVAPQLMTPPRIGRLSVLKMQTQNAPGLGAGRAEQTQVLSPRRRLCRELTVSS